MHELKTDPIPFCDLWDGVKTFEFRLDDRDYKITDRLVLRETVFSAAEMQCADRPLGYTGRRIEALILYKLKGCKGMHPGYCILSIIVLKRRIAIKAQLC